MEQDKRMTAFFAYLAEHWARAHGNAQDKAFSKFIKCKTKEVATMQNGISVDDLNKAVERESKCARFRETHGVVQDRYTATWARGRLPGGFTMHNFGASPNDAAESRLSSILEEQPQVRYYLSAKAAQGLLRRAEKMGSRLPDAVKNALQSIAGETSAESRQQSQ